MTDDLLTPEEHHAMEMTANLWNYLSTAVVGDGPGHDGDMRELMFHIHGIHRAILAQAAARAYPDMYRLLGSGAVRTQAYGRMGYRDEGFALDHSCSCHVNMNECGLCRDLKCPIALARDAAEAREQSEHRRTDEIRHVVAPGEDGEIAICEVRFPLEQLKVLELVGPGILLCEKCKKIITALDKAYIIEE